MLNKSSIFKGIVILILLEACTLTTPRSSTAPSQPLNSPPQVQNTLPPAATAVPTNPVKNPPKVAGAGNNANSTPSDSLTEAQQKIKHIVIIMQENRVLSILTSAPIPVQTAYRRPVASSRSA